MLGKIMKIDIKYTPNKNNETVLNKNKNVYYFSFDALNKFSKLKNAFSTKLGGVSKGIYKSMNLGVSTEDSKENILLNYQEFAKAINLNPNNLVITRQIHSTNIKVVNDNDRGKGFNKERDEEGVDGFVTNTKGLGLCILVADCVPVYLYDPVKEAIGLVHSGWKGTLGQISSKAINLMHDSFGSNPEDIICVIGPSICQDCYEVSYDLYDEFSKVYEKNKLKEIFLPGKDSEHFQLGLWKAIKYTLLDNNIKEENIHITDVCTCHNPDLLFSHRYTNGKRGNLAAVLMLLPEPKEKNIFRIK